MFRYKITYQISGSVEKPELFWTGSKVIEADNPKEAKKQSSIPEDKILTIKRA